MNIHNRGVLLLVVALFGQVIFSQQARSEGDDAILLEGIVRQIVSGWEQSDGKPFREHFLDFDGARYVESGRQNVGLGNLIEHHVEVEGDALDDLELKLSNIEVHVEGSFAWVITTLEISAIVKIDKREINHNGYETFIFRHVDNEWKVVHSHRSSRAITTEKEHEH